MSFTDNSTIFAQIYNLAVSFMTSCYEFCSEVMLSPFPYSQWFRNTWAEFRILGNLFPGSNQFWYYAALDEWSTARVILILAVTFWIYMIVTRFVAKLILELIDIFT